MSNVIIGKPAANELFKTNVCNIGNGAVVINLRTCDVKINPTLTIDKAAKLAAYQVYHAMEHPGQITQEPEWVNMVSFATEELPDKPAIKIIDNKLFINSPPFLKTKKNINFWKRFTDYWHIMVIKAMDRALACRQDKTFKEEQDIERYANIDI